VNRSSMTIREWRSREFATAHLGTDAFGTRSTRRRQGEGTPSHFSGAVDHGAPEQSHAFVASDIGAYFARGY
jgi:hypothetical protein